MGLCGRAGRVQRAGGRSGPAVPRPGAPALRVRRAAEPPDLRRRRHPARALHLRALRPYADDRHAVRCWLHPEATIKLPILLTYGCHVVLQTIVAKPIGAQAPTVLSTVSEPVHVPVQACRGCVPASLSPAKITTHTSICSCSDLRVQCRPRAHYPSPEACVCAGMAQSRLCGRRAA